MSPSCRRTEIYLVRHAEVHNPRDIAYGRLPRFRLSARGRTQAERTATFLSGRPLSAIYTSPLLRARQTAAIISQYHPSAPVRQSRLLLEVFTGYEGSPNTIYTPGFSFYEPLARPGDETMEDVFRRMDALVRRILRLHAGRSVAVVSHADPIAIARVGLEDRPLTVANLHATVYPYRASVTHVILDADELPRLAYFNPAESEA